MIPITLARKQFGINPLVAATEWSGGGAHRCDIRVDPDVSTIATAREHLRTPKRLQEWKQRTRPTTDVIVAGSGTGQPVPGRRENSYAYNARPPRVDRRRPL